MMVYPNLCYRYVAQPSLYERTEFCLRFLLAFFAKSKSHQNTKIEIVTDYYRVFFIRLSPFTCIVALLSKNDLIIEMFHPCSLI